ncbi:transglutaminase domain-containing protein [bacterium]|nr:MAG: transglutaminase domain-containing protein [bacterium]
MLLATLPPADSPQYLGIFAGGRRIGYSVATSAEVPYEGATARRSESKTRMKIALQATPLDLEVDSSTYTVNGSIRRIRFVQRSGGRTSGCEAIFGDRTVEIVMTSEGNRTTSTVAKPEGEIVDDPVNYFLEHPGAKEKTFWVLDPTAGAFVRNVARVKGPARVSLGAVSAAATRIDVVDPRMTTTVYVSAKGDFLKATTPIGIDTMPLAEKDALAPLEEGAPLDLATVTALVPDKPIVDAPNLSRLRLKITGIDLASMPSGGHQAAKSVRGGWIVEVKPPVARASAKVGAVGQTEFTRPTAYLPSDDPTMVAEAKRIVGGETNLAAAAQKIRREVYRTMQPNAGIGVLRDAREVFATKEGVCRDYAVLTTTLMRAAGIPARLATGLVTWDGTFYYHAWTEVWDGANWIGMDSASPTDRISAGHVKLSEGNVDRAFVFPVLGRAKIAVLAQS